MSPVSLCLYFLMSDLCLLIFIYIFLVSFLPFIILSLFYIFSLCIFLYPVSFSFSLALSPVSSWVWSFVPLHMYLYISFSSLLYPQSLLDFLALCIFPYLHLSSLNFPGSRLRHQFCIPAISNFLMKIVALPDFCPSLLSHLAQPLPDLGLFLKLEHALLEKILWSFVKLIFCKKALQ